MWIVLLLLGLPALAWGLLWSDAKRQKHLPLRDRHWWAFLVRSFGGGLIGSGLVIVGRFWFDLPSDYLSIPFFLLISFAALYVGVQAHRVPNLLPGPDEDPDSAEVLNRLTPLSLLAEPIAGRMRSVAWFLIVYPLLFAVAFISVFGIGLILLLLLVLTNVLRSRRAFESQLLWLLTVSVRHQIPIAGELEQFSKSQGERRKRQLKAAVKSLNAGEPLSMVLQRHKLVSIPTVCAIRVAEAGPRLEETLLRLAHNATDRMRATSLDRLGGGLVQLTALMLVGTTILSGVMYFIVPKFKTIFEGFEVEFPAITTLLINASDMTFRGGSWWFFWIGAMSVGMTFLAMLQIVGWSGISFPLFMQWFPRRDGPEVLRTLAGASRDRATLPERLALAADRPGRPDLGARYQRVADAVRDGGELGPALQREGLVSPLQAEGIAAAEKAGHLEFMLTSLAEAIHRKQVRRFTFWAELVNPVLVIAAGCVVAFVVIGLFMPLVKLLGELS